MMNELPWIKHGLNTMYCTCPASQRSLGPDDLGTMYYALVHKQDRHGPFLTRTSSRRPLSLGRT